MQDRHYHDLCSFYLTQIGENIKNISKGLVQKYPAIHWKGLIGMRNILSHAYHNADFETVWVTITNELPLLKETCEEILKEHGTD